MITRCANIIVHGKNCFTASSIILEFLLKILIIEDNPDHVELIEDVLESMPVDNINIVSELTILGGTQRIDNESFDVCLCDLKLSDSTMEQTVEWLGRYSVNLPIVTLTSLSYSKVADDLLANGVQDYIPKEELSAMTLFRACRYAIERWRHQQQIREHNKDMQAFCASLSHDFNNSIGQITTITSNIKYEFEQRYTLTDKDQKWFRLLDSSTTGIIELVDNLQQYLSVEYSDRAFEQVSLSDIAEKVDMSLKMSLLKSFTFNYDKNMPLVSGNPSLLQLLLQNLLSNSIKFCTQQPVVHLEAVAVDNGVNVRFIDNGIGFDISESDKLFKPFKRLSNGAGFSGTGLGLSIVHQVVTHHGGSVSVDSTVGEGTTFTIFLPKG